MLKYSLIYNNNIIQFCRFSQTEILENNFRGILYTQDYVGRN